MKPGGEPTAELPKACWTYGDWGFVFSFFSETPLALLGTCRKEGRSPLRPYSAPGSAGMEIVCWEGREGDGTADRAAPADSPDLLCAPGCRVPWVSPPGEVWILLNGLFFFFPLSFRPAFN